MTGQDIFSSETFIAHGTDEGAGAVGWEVCVLVALEVLGSAETAGTDIADMYGFEVDISGLRG